MRGLQLDTYAPDGVWRMCYLPPRSPITGQKGLLVAIGLRDSRVPSKSYRPFAHQRCVVTQVRSYRLVTWCRAVSARFVVRHAAVVDAADETCACSPEVLRSRKNSKTRKLQYVTK